MSNVFLQEIRLFLTISFMLLHLSIARMISLDKALDSVSSGLDVLKKLASNETFLEVPQYLSL